MIRGHEMAFKSRALVWTDYYIKSLRYRSVSLHYVIYWGFFNHRMRSPKSCRNGVQNFDLFGCVTRVMWTSLQSSDALTACWLCNSGCTDIKISKRQLDDMQRNQKLSLAESRQGRRFPKSCTAHFALTGSDDGYLNSHFLFVFYHFFDGQLQTEGKKQHEFLFITQTNLTPHPKNIQLNCAAAAS